LCVATLKSLELIKLGEQKAKLLANIDYFRNFAKSLDLNFEQSESAIQPMIIGESDKALEFSKKLFEMGFFVSAIRPPTVPPNTARLRFTLCANHSFLQIEALLERVKNVMA
jgi:8-amino-7-oxononanoate synthase